jgi:hypothetical protein
MSEPTLKKILRNRLPVYHSKKYLAWFGKNVSRGLHKHHLLESSMGGHKLNGYLLVPKTPEQHRKIHYTTDGENPEMFMDDFISALNNLFKYVEYLENN